MLTNMIEANIVSDVGADAWVDGVKLKMVYNAKSDDTGTVEEFTRRKEIKITTGGASTPANYQVKVTVAYEPEMQSAFQDIRFNTKAGTYIDYWIESKTDSSIADVWIELPDAITDPGSDIIWMYYGNPSAASASNGNATFGFFDDFETKDTSKWNFTNADFSVASGIATITFTGTGERGIHSTTHFGTGYAMDALYNDDSPAADPFIEFGDSGYAAGYNHVALYSGSTTYRLYSTNNYPGDQGNVDTGVTLGLRRISIKRSTTNVVSVIDGTATTLTPTIVNTNILGVGVAQGSYDPSPDSGQTLNWIFVRKYTSPEPTAAVGTAQQQKKTP